MEEQRAPLQFHFSEDSRTIHPARGPRLQQPAEARGPYETTYTITLGYPDREVLER